jgi:hypothetical protein
MQGSSSQPEAVTLSFWRDLVFIFWGSLFECDSLIHNSVGGTHFVFVLQEVLCVCACVYVLHTITTSFG